MASQHINLLRPAGTNARSCTMPIQHRATTLFTGAVIGQSRGLRVGTSLPRPTRLTRRLSFSPPLRGVRKPKELPTGSSLTSSRNRHRDAAKEPTPLEANDKKRKESGYTFRNAEVVRTLDLKKAVQQRSFITLRGTAEHNTIWEGLLVMQDGRKVPAELRRGNAKGKLPSGTVIPYVLRGSSILRLKSTDSKQPERLIDLGNGLNIGWKMAWREMVLQHNLFATSLHLPDNIAQGYFTLFELTGTRGAMKATCWLTPDHPIPISIVLDPSLVSESKENIRAFPYVDHGGRFRIRDVDADRDLVWRHSGERTTFAESHSKEEIRQRHPDLYHAAVGMGYFANPELATGVKTVVEVAGPATTIHQFLQFIWDLLHNDDSRQSKP